LILDNANANASKCKAKYENLQKNADYVECQICGYCNKKIMLHLKAKHNINRKNYEKTYKSLTICENSSKSYSNAGMGRENWITIAQREGKDLTEYKEKLSKTISKTVMSDPDERERRSKLMIEINNVQKQNPEYIKSLSERAKKTSARPDIIEKRSAQLKRWRDNNPEEFKSQCTDHMLTYKSKPEKILLNIITNKYDGFKGNQFIIDDMFLQTSKAKRKQVDIANIKEKILIEFDGHFHFKNVEKFNNLEISKLRDSLLNEYASKNDYTLIRISHDQFIYKNKNEFKPECLEQLFKLIDEKIPGVYKIGELYQIKEDTETL